MSLLKTYKLKPRLKPLLGLREILAALNFFSKGNVETFEKSFAAKFGNRFGVMFQHGRSGIYALLKSWNLENSEIICPAYTCVVVPHAIVLSGNIPVFVDCEEGSFNMSLPGIEASITSKTRVVIVTHLFGFPMDVMAISEIVSKAEQRFQQKIYIIQDVAHSFGCTWENKLVTLSGDAAIFGLNVSKTITSIFGGMIITNSESCYNRLIEYRRIHFKKKSLRQIFKRLVYLIVVYCAFNEIMYKVVHALERGGLIDRFIKYYDESVINFPDDWNFLPSEIEARVGKVQLKKYDTIVDRRIRNAQKIINHYSGNNQIVFPGQQSGATYSHCVGLVASRDIWIEKFHGEGIQLGILIEYAIPYMEAYKRYRKREYPISHYYSEHTINFPLNGNVDYVNYFNW